MGTPRLSVIRPFDPWKSPLCTCPAKWVVHPYTGCSYNCLYCYATSYIPRHNIVRMKSSFLGRLEKDILRVPRGSLIELSSSSDPYPPMEAQSGLTRKLLQILLSNGFNVLVVTKSTLVVRDLDIFTKYRNNVVVSITITTLRDDIAKVLEPGAPPPSDRLKAIEILSNNRVNVVARVDPIIPGINDNYKDLRDLVKELSRRGVKQITSSTYKARADSLKRIAIAFPSISRDIFEAYSRNRVEYIHGYRYLNKSVRLQYMKMMKELAEEEGLAFGVCREGFPNLNTPGFSCDGSAFLYTT